MISHVGRYEVIRELGQGAMGMVYQAKDPLIERIVAVKTISLAIAQDEREEYEARFYQEAKAAGRLNHPNIVTIYDVGKSGDLAYIAMEFLEGYELRDMMNESGILPLEQVIDIVIQVAQGLSYAHQHGIVHRDIKPSNIMVDEDWHVKITDFGIARMASSSVRTQVGMVLGSPKYMSPEQVLGKTLDQRSDIFSLGVMLYEMLTARAPFTGENVNAIMYQTLNANPPPPKLLNDRLPEMMNFIVAKALAKKINERYQSAKEFAQDLRQCRDALMQGGSKPAAAVSAIPVVEKSVRETVVESKANASGLSPQFDSNEATMRLATMTGSKEDVDELSKTLKISRPSTAEATKPEVKPQKPEVKVIRPPQPAQAQLFRTTEPAAPVNNTVTPTKQDKLKKMAPIIGAAVLVLVILIYLLM